MPRIEIKPVGHIDIAVPKFSTGQMRELAQMADDLMDKRVDSPTPTNIFGEPRPELSKKYSERKKREGKRPVRDMHRTGETLRAKQVLGEFESDSEVGATVGIRGSTYFWRGLKAQNVDPWFGLTGDEEAIIRQHALGMFESNIAAANAK